MVVFTQSVNGVTGDSQWNAMDDDYDFRQEIARSAFADMLHDAERNRKYFRALKAAVKEMHDRGVPANVLDIGTGTGLLSMMAAECGADSIVACEAFAPIADCATRIVEKNGYADKIKIIPKRSTELRVGPDQDLESKANILVTEVFDTELIGEGAIETFHHAHAHLLERDCIVVPQSATVYAQIVQCEHLQAWNRLNDVYDQNVKLLSVPTEIKECPGSAAVHDLQLSQLPSNCFKPLSDPIAVFEFDWSGKSEIKKKRTVTHKVECSSSGSAQMVFVWWDLKMDINNDIILSCAPWWNHPDAELDAEHPADTIPWRDHWMQSVYYFPLDVNVKENQEVSLACSHDEYSLWFDLDAKKMEERPICVCGVHMTYSRTHIAYMNDCSKNQKLIHALKKRLNAETVCLCLNGASLIGLIAAKLGAKKVIYVESGVIAKRVLNELVKCNRLCSAVDIIPSVEDLNEVERNSISLVLSDPHFNSAILPWDNLRHGYFIAKLNLLSNPNVGSIPLGCSVWAMAVDFLDLHKIKSPLGVCEGVDLNLFDKLIKDSRSRCDEDIEPQPLWEYPCICKSKPINIVNIDFSNANDVSKTATGSTKCEIKGAFNGFAFWTDWNLDSDSCNAISDGPSRAPVIDQRVEWNPRIRQGVKLFERPEYMNKDSVIDYKFSYDLRNGDINVHIDVSKTS